MPESSFYFLFFCVLCFVFRVLCFVFCVLIYKCSQRSRQLCSERQPGSAGRRGASERRRRDEGYGARAPPKHHHLRTLTATLPSPSHFSPLPTPPSPLLGLARAYGRHHRHHCLVRLVHPAPPTTNTTPPTPATIQHHNLYCSVQSVHPVTSCRNRLAQHHPHQHHSPPPPPPSSCVGSLWQRGSGVMRIACAIPHRRPILSTTLPSQTPPPTTALPSPDRVPIQSHHHRRAEEGCGNHGFRVCIESHTATTSELSPLTG